MSELLVPVLRVRDASAASPWYGRLGFTKTGEHRFAPHLPAYVFLERGTCHLHLSEHKGDAPKRGLVYFWVDDVDQIASEFDVTVESQPWAREVMLTDPDGNRIRVGTRTKAEGDHAP